MGLFANLRKPWLRKGYRSVTFRMKVNYILRHLGRYDLGKIYVNSNWQDAKEGKVLEQLDSGRSPLSIPPIKLVLHNKKEEFRVEDGISRLRAFRKRRIKYIYATVRIGSW
jgi:hypothetical protein